MFKNLLALSGLLLAHASVAQVDLNTPYNCTVTESTRAGLKVGSKTNAAITLSSLKASGAIQLGEQSLDLYSQVEELDGFAPKSGYLVLASDVSRPSEFHASVFVMPKADNQIELTINLVRTTSAYKKATGERTFIVDSSPAQRFKLWCE